MYQFKETITGGALEPLSLDEVKRFMRVSFDSDDSQIQGIITRVRQLTEQYLDRSFIKKGIVYYEEAATDNVITLPFPQHLQLNTVYVDNVDVTNSVTKKGLTQFSLYYGFEGKEVTVDYSTDGYCEEGIKSAMLKEVVNQYQNKDSYYLENPAQLSDTYLGLLQPYVRGGF